LVEWSSFLCLWFSLKIAVLTSCSERWTLVTILVFDCLLQANAHAQFSFISFSPVYSWCHSFQLSFLLLPSHISSASSLKLHGVRFILHKIFCFY
jgi:hypothetical protein